MKNKKILPLLGIILLLLTSGGLTYAFFQAQSSDPVTRDVHVLTHTVDMLTFSIDADISLEATQQNFARNGVNQSDEANVTAILTPNSKTGTATKNYYLYLNIESNPFVYSAANTNHDPELLLQVFDSSDNLVTLTGLGNQVTIDSLTGYDITTARGLKILLDNQTITASNNATTTQEWRVVVTLVNLDVNQNDNTGKTFEAELIIQEDELIQETFVYWNDNFGYTHEYASNEAPTGSGLNGTYETREQLATAYSNWSNNPIYIKTTKVNGTVTGHTACLWYNNREFCIAPNYWNTDSATTKAKLKADMENALGITIADYSCTYDAIGTTCGTGDLYCNADSNGDVDCASLVVTYGDCYVNSSGDASCSE